MRTKIVAVAALIALALATATLHAGQAPAGQASQSPAVDARIARVEGGLLPGIVVAGAPPAAMRLADRMAFYKTPGVSVAVINDGRIEWARGYGVTEAGGNTPVTPRTRFQAASISKPIAALAAMRLVEKGRLALDQPVNARLVSWKVPDNSFTVEQAVTLRRLLSHTAGLTVSGFPGYAAGTTVPTLTQVLDGVKPANTEAIRVNVLPGSIWRYAGGGYTVAQQLMMDVTGKTFPVLMSELVLGPIAMTDSTYEQPLPAALQREAASGHRSSGQVLPGRYHTYPEMAAAGLWTTPTDLAKFALELQRALTGSSPVITAAGAREMVTVQKDGYGLGLSMSGSGPAERFGHGGSNAGFKCQMTAFMSGGKGVVIMTNGDQGGRLASEIVRAVAREYGWGAFVPRERRVMQVEPRLLAVLEGRYELTPAKTLTVRLEDGKLFIIDGDQRVELYAESDSLFFDLVEENTIVFLKDATGAVTSMLINGTLSGRRLPSEKK